MSTQKNAPAAAAYEKAAKIGESGEDMYDSIKANNWSTALKLNTWLKSYLKQTDSTVISLQDKKALFADISSLETSLGKKNRMQSLLVANHITYTATAVSAHRRQLVPADISFLDFYGREVEIRAGAKDAPERKRAISEIKKIWSAVRKEVVRRGGTAEAERFDKTVSMLESAKKPAEYSGISVRLLDEVDELEAVFTGK